jgi:hypothetical protein
MKHRIILLVSVAVLLTACAAKKSPQAALEEFYTHEGAEDTLMDPLIVAGEDVVPLVVERVKDRDMPRRRYAIGFLGNGGYRQALPVLREILADGTEKDYFRGDALHAIYMIDETLGRELARKHLGETNHVGWIAKSILAGEVRVRERRSLLDAARGYHE